MQAAGCINAAFIAESPHVYSDVYVDSDALGDVVTATEAEALAEYAARIQSTHARKELVLEARDKILHKYFVKSAPQNTRPHKQDNNRGGCPKRMRRTPT